MKSGSLTSPSSRRDLLSPPTIGGHKTSTSSSSLASLTSSVTNVMTSPALLPPPPQAPHPFLPGLPGLALPTAGHPYAYAYPYSPYYWPPSAYAPGHADLGHTAPGHTVPAHPATGYTAPARTPSSKGSSGSGTHSRGTSPLVSVKKEVAPATVAKETKSRTMQTVNKSVSEAGVQADMTSVDDTTRRIESASVEVSAKPAVADDSTQTENLNNPVSDNGARSQQQQCSVCQCSCQGRVLPPTSAANEVQSPSTTTATTTATTLSSNEASHGIRPQQQPCDSKDSPRSNNSSSSSAAQSSSSSTTTTTTTSGSADDLISGGSNHALHILSTLALHMTPQTLSAPPRGNHRSTSGVGNYHAMTSSSSSPGGGDFTRPLSIDTSIGFSPLSSAATSRGCESPDLSADYNVPKSIYFRDEFIPRRRRPSKAASSVSEDEFSSSVFKIATGR